MKQHIERIPLTKDFMFKNVFGKYGNEDILAAFLETIIKTKITKLEIQNGELPKNDKENKLGILDIRAQINDGTIVNIELQMCNESNLGDRLSYYQSNLYSNSLKINEDYSESNKVIVIALINFSYYKRPEYHMIAHMKFEENTNEEEIVDVQYIDKKDELVTEKLEMHIIDMKRYLRKEEAKGELSDWLNLILDKGDKIKMAVKKNEKIKKADEEVKRLSQTEEMQELYWLEEKARIRENTMKSVAYKKGIEKGENRGIKKGIEQGKKEGIKENKIETARKMILKNIPIEIIKEITGLTEEEIKKLI